ncbi:MAG: TetR/AcrR family transcriptional regulator [Coriobacteriia bacterium]|nr:TetR/AcrR family transcriptional regulator [Coriobacteriia bacterium]
MARRSTKEHIVDVAIALFNERGTAAVSTNHIAEAAGISPGNLYYHFRNKEEIILQAYERALCAYDQAWANAGTAPPSPHTILELLEETFGAQWRYRFLQREMSWLVQTNEALRVRYRDVMHRRLAYYHGLIRAWIAAGVCRPLPDDQLDDLVLASWVVGEQWLTYLEAMGEATDEQAIRRGGRLILEVFRPHLIDLQGHSSVAAEGPPS